MADPQKLMEAIDRLVWNTVSLRLVTSGGVHASLSTRRDIERLVGESRQQLVDELTKALDTPGVMAADNWQQYAKDGETAQACIERHRREQDTLLKLLAQSREPLTSEQIIALLPAGWTGMLAQVMEFARRIEAARGVATDGKDQP